MSWDEIGQGGGGDFLKIETGKKVKLHVLSAEPFSFFQHFFSTIQRGAVCPGDGCPACAEGTKEHKKRQQHSLVIITDAGEVKVWTGGNSAMQAVKNIYDTYGDLSTVDLVILRTGTGLDTKYGITPVPTVIDFSGVDMDTLPNLEEINAPSSTEDIDQMLLGIIPENAQAAVATAAGEETAPAEEAPAEEAPAPVPAKAAPKAQAKPATAKGPDPRMPLVKEILGLLATNAKYKTQQAKAALFKACAPGKLTMSAMTLQDLIKVRNALKK